METSTLNKLAGLIHAMELKDRIKLAMDGAKLSPADLARATKSTNAAVTFWLSGKTKALKAEKAALLEVATGFNGQWIVSGKGPQKNSGNTTQAIEQNMLLAQEKRASYAINTVATTLERFGLLVAESNDLTRDQLKTLLIRICDQPERRTEITNAMTKLFDSGNDTITEPAAVKSYRLGGG